MSESVLIAVLQCPFPEVVQYNGGQIGKYLGRMLNAFTMSSNTMITIPLSLFSIYLVRILTCHDVDRHSRNPYWPVLRSSLFWVECLMIRLAMILEHLAGIVDQADWSVDRRGLWSSAPFIQEDQVRPLPRWGELLLWEANYWKALGLSFDCSASQPSTPLSLRQHLAWPMSMNELQLPPNVGAAPVLSRQRLCSTA